MKLGYEHRDRAGERYEPSAAIVEPDLRWDA
jgi:hypothetical protein